MWDFRRRILTSYVRRPLWKCRPPSDVPREFTFTVSFLIATAQRFFNFGSPGNIYANSTVCVVYWWYDIGARNNSCLAWYLPVKKWPLTHFVRLVYRPLRLQDPASIPQCNSRLVRFGLTSSCFREIWERGTPNGQTHTPLERRPSWEKL